MADNVFKQVCNGCNVEFDVEYKKDGSYVYVGEPCDCEDGFSPADSSTPSISQWLAQCN